MSSQLRWSIIKQFSRRNVFGFRFRDVVKEFPEKHRVCLARILADMVDKGMLCKITRGNYQICNLSNLNALHSWQLRNRQPKAAQNRKYSLVNFGVDEGPFQTD